MIEFKQVNKHFGSLHVLQDINLTVKEGAVTVICGPSGSGKSTLIRTINQLEAISAGDIWVDGKSIFDPTCSLNALRKEIGFVFQQFNLYPHLSVLENITLAPRKLNNQLIWRTTSVLMLCSWVKHTYRCYYRCWCRKRCCQWYLFLRFDPSTWTSMSCQQI